MNSFVARSETPRNRDRSLATGGAGALKFAIRRVLARPMLP